MEQGKEAWWGWGRNVDIGANLVAGQVVLLHRELRPTQARKETDEHGAADVVSVAHQRIDPEVLVDPPQGTQVMLEELRRRTRCIIITSFRLRRDKLLVKQVDIFSHTTI